MTAVNASTLGDENVENSKKLQQAVVGKKEVAADGTVTTTGVDLTTKINAANKAIEDALKTTGATAYSKTNLDAAIDTANGLIEKALADKNISKAANEAFTTLKDKLDKCKVLSGDANDAKYDANAASNVNEQKVAKLNALKTGIEEVTTAFEEAYAITNSQMTTLDELRTTLQGFVAKPNDVNLDHTSFTTFLDVY